MDGRGPDGVDTALARHLHARGVDVALLQRCLAEVRAGRAGPAAADDAALATLLVARRLVDPVLIDACAADLATPAPRLPARRVGDYRLVGELGQGGMGVVHEAIHEPTGVRVALKALPLRVAAGAPRARFEREALAQARLKHPAIVPIHTAALEGEVPYLVQDLLPGGSLAQRLRAGPLPFADCVDVISRLGDALTHAHAQGVLHRDLKPGNVLFDERGRACLTDFGLAGFGEGADRLTRTGEIMGTPACMAPEQARDAKSVDGRADVYGLGAILYACLTGRLPFEDYRGLFQTLGAVLHNDPQPPSALRPDVPSQLEAACLRALAKSPDERFPTPQALVDALQPPAPTRAGGRLAAGILLTLAVITGAAWLAAARHAAVSTAPRATPSPAASPAADGALADALARLAAADAVPAPLEDRARGEIVAHAQPAAVVSQLGGAPPGQVRDALLALALVCDGRLLELASWEQPLPPSADRLRALARCLDEGWRLLRRGERPTPVELARTIRQTLNYTVPLSAEPGSARLLPDVQWAIANLVAAYRVISRESPDDAPVAARLAEARALAPGDGARAIDLARVYVEPEDEPALFRELVTAVGGARLRPRERYWLAVTESRLRRSNRWRAVGADELARRRWAFAELDRKELSAYSFADGEALGQAISMDLLHASFLAHRADQGERAHALADEAILHLSTGSHGKLFTAIRLVGWFLRPTSSVAEFERELREPGDEAWRRVFDAEVALAGGQLARARELLGPVTPARAPLEDGIVRLHMAVLAGELTVEQALASREFAAAQARDASAYERAGTEASMGFYWHRPEHFAETLRGAWWPGRAAFAGR